MINYVLSNHAPTAGEKYNSKFEFTAVMEEDFKFILQEYLKEEVAQGERTELPEGMVRYEMNLTKEKMDPIIEAIKTLHAKLSAGQETEQHE